MVPLLPPISSLRGFAEGNGVMKCLAGQVTYCTQTLRQTLKVIDLEAAVAPLELLDPRSETGDGESCAYCARP
jgi:hypothetical protein